MNFKRTRKFVLIGVILQMLVGVILTVVALSLAIELFKGDQPVAEKVGSKFEQIKEDFNRGREATAADTLVINK